MKLLLVDSRVADKAIVKTSLLGDIDMVEFDFFGETAQSLVNKIDDKEYSSIGLFQENYDRDAYSLITSVVGGLVKDVSTIDSDLVTWNSIINLLSAIKEKTHFTTLDLMGCGIYSSNDWKYIISSLESKLAININASIDYTGDVSLGGNWILEEGNLNLIGTYFNSNIKEYKHILGGQGPSTFVVANVDINSNTGKPTPTGFNNSILYGVGNNVTNLNFTQNSPVFIKTVNSGDTFTSAIINGGTSFYIDTNGKLWVTGNNYYGQLGTDDTDVRPIWVQLPNDLLDLNTNNLSVVDVFGEYNNSRYTFLLLSDGSVWHAGLNTGFGNNKKFTKIYNPATNAGKKAVKINGTSGDLCILFNDGTASFARFSGSIANSLTYFPGKTVVGIDSAYDMNAVLFSDGTAAAWNIMENVPIANITSPNSQYRYFDFPAGVTKFTKLFMNYYRQILLIDNNGAIWFGLGNYNNGDKGFVKIYNPTTNNNLKAIKVYCDKYSQDSNGLINMNGVIFVLLEDGSLMAGGINYWGCFGNNSFTQNQNLTTLQTIYTPTGLTDKIINVSFANSCTMITKQDNSIWVAGYNNNTFGIYSTNSTNYIVDLGINAKQVSTNGYSTAIVTADSKLYVRGQNNTGQLGLGNYTDVTTYTLVNTTSILSGGLEIVFASMGGGYIPGGGRYGHLIMVISDGSVWATGNNNSGQSGYGSGIGISNVFRKIYTPDSNDVNTKAFTCSAGKLDSLFVLNNGKVYRCNLDNINVGPTVAYTPDANPINPGDKFAATYACAGPFHSSIVTADGSVWMIGQDDFAARLNNLYSGFGLGYLTESEFKSQFPNWNTFGTYADYRIEIYGTGANVTPLFNRVTKLNKFVRTYHPEKNAGVGAVLVGCGSSDVGSNYSAIILADGSVWTTGNNNYGQLGTGNNNSLTAWTKVYFPTIQDPYPAKTVLCGDQSTSIIYNNAVYSTGYNFNGQLGTGNTLNLNTFTQMKSLSTFGKLNDAYALNDAQAILITTPAFGPFSIESKFYDYVNSDDSTKTFIINAPTSTSQGVFSFTSSDSTIASIETISYVDSGTGLTFYQGKITINDIGKLGTVTIRATQEPWRTFTDIAFKETTFTVKPISPQLSNFSVPQKWYQSRTLGISPFNITPPTTLSAGEITYTSSVPTVATINSITGEITIIGIGSTVIAATQAANGIYDTEVILTTFTVNPLVNPNLSNFTISNVLYDVQPFTFTKPTYLGDGAITYSVTNVDGTLTDIASIDSVTGEITINTIGKLGTVKVIASLEDSGIYFSSSKSTTFTVLPLNPQLSGFSIENKVYGDEPFNIVPPTTLSAGTFTYSLLNTNNNNINTSVLSLSGNTLRTIGTGTIRVKAVQEANGVYDTSSIETTITVSKALPVYETWTIRRRPLNYFDKFGLDLFVNNPNQVPYLNALSETTSNGTFTYSSSDPSIASVNSITGKLTLNTVGETIITVTQAETDNFLSNTISTIFKVTNPDPVYGNFTIGVKRYGDAPFTISAPTSTNPVRMFTFTSSDPSILSISRIDDENAIATINSTGPVTITCTQIETEDFVEGSVSFELNVLKIITILDRTNQPFSVPSGKNYLSLPFAVFSPSSNRPGSFTFASSNTNVATINPLTGQITITGAGETDISVTQDETIFYYPDTVSATLTVAKAPSQITSTFNDLTVNYLSNDVILENPTTTNTDTNVFSYSSSNTFVASLVNNVLTFNNAGSATITCTLLESANFLSSSTTFNVTVTPINTTYPNGYSIDTITYAPNLVITIPEPESANPGTFSYVSSNPIIASVSGNQLSIHRAGIINITATETATNNYNLGSISTSLTILRATPIVGQFTVPSKVFGDDPFSITIPITDSDGTWSFTSSDETIASISGNTITVVNSGLVTITAVLQRTLKYATATVTTSFRVFKRPATITFNNITKTFGDANFTVDFTSDNTNPVSFSIDDTTVAVIDSVTGLVTIVGAGEANITATQDEDENIGPVESIITLTVNKADPTFEPYVIKKVAYYDDSFILPALQSNSNGQISYSNSNSNVLDFNSITRLADPLKVGNTEIIITQEESPNYNAKTLVVPLNIGICFPAGTPVTTDQGIINIENINPEINTIRGNKIVAITKTVTLQKHIVTIEKNALAMNMPNKNTFISMNHCVLYKGKMERARDLVEKVDGVYLKKYNGEILYNVLLEKHSKMVVNNMIVETLDPTNIVAKLYSGNYTNEEFNNLSVEISKAVIADDKKKFEKIYKSLK